jgi:hypothetical protein
MRLLESTAKEYPKEKQCRPESGHHGQRPPEENLHYGQVTAHGSLCSGLTRGRSSPCVRN